ncbi:MAG: hypothetical protein QOJ55_1231 [Solirubrobacteraceae bacterium]|jgi:hypothetical protein|nr:hypothetical protein [Solirubrobacteraceae bacterium]
MTGRPGELGGGVRLAIVLPLLVLAAAGCGGGSGPTTTPENGVLVRYERRGGVTHTEVSITVREDGRGTRTSSDPRLPSAPFTLAPDRLARLRRALRDADLAHLRSNGSPPPADGYEYTLSASGRTLRFPQGGLPRPLVPVIALLEGRAYAA